MLSGAPDHQTPHCVCACVYTHACLLRCSFFMCVCECELWTRAVIIGAYRPERGRRRGARAGLGTSDRCRGGLMTHPDSNGQSHTQPEKIFHTPNFFHSIKLSINYFNPQIKDSTKRLMFIRWYSLEPGWRQAPTVWFDLYIQLPTHWNDSGLDYQMANLWKFFPDLCNSKVNTTNWPIHPALSEFVVT